MAASSCLASISGSRDNLQCPLCLHQLETPFTLQECLHTFCKACLDELLPQTTKDNITGWTCLRCQTFSGSEQVEHNVFMQKLLDNKTAGKTDTVDKMTCKQCTTEAEAMWRCADCKLELCAGCQSTHLNIPLLKGHQIILLNTEKTNEPVIIDELLFCSKHTEKLIEAHCKGCKVLLCFLCKMEDHDTHATETVNVALKRLVPELKEHNQTITKQLEYLKKKVTFIRSKMEDTKKSFAESKKHVQERCDCLMEELKTIKFGHDEVLAAKEKEALKVLEETKLDLEAKVEQVEQLLNMSTLTTNNAKNVTLLTQLQAGLFEKVKVCSETKSKSFTVSLELAKLVFTVEQDKVELAKIFGKIKETYTQCRINRDDLMQDKLIGDDVSTDVGKISFAGAIKTVVERAGPMFSKSESVPLNIFRRQEQTGSGGKGLSDKKLQVELDRLIIERQVTNEEVFDWVDTNVGEVNTKKPAFIRALMTSVCSSALSNKYSPSWSSLSGGWSRCEIDSETVKKRGLLLTEYLSVHDPVQELQALYALQALVHKLQHPPGILRIFFDTLYDNDIISEDAFNMWYDSPDPAEEVGRGAARQAVVQFFRWLRESEDEEEDDGEEEEQEN